MRAAIRLSTGRPCSDWTDDEVTASYALLRRPAVPFADWFAAVSPDDPGPAADPAPGPGADADGLTDEMIEANEQNLAAFKAAMGAG